jgi:hypothetical protein
MQVGQAHSEPQQQENMTRAMLGVGMVLMGHFAFSYSAFVVEAQNVLAENPKAKEIAEKWRFGKDDMKYP